MRSKTINLFESIQQNSITNVIDKVAEQFKSEIIEEYKASETKEMSTELENKITKALALEGVDSPEDWVADVCSVALDMTPTGEALAIKEDENTDIKGQLKQLGIKSIYVSDEHKRADEDELNKLGGLEYNYRLQRNPSKAHYYSYLSIKHETLGDIYISFDVETNKIDTTGFPWNFIKEATTPEIKEFIETNEEFFNNLLKSKELSTGINLNESAILDKIGNIIPEGYKEYMLSNDFTAKTFNSKEKLLKDLKSYNITSFKDAVNNTLTINCKDMYGHRFKTIITWKHLNNKVQESANDNKLTKSIMKGMTKINYECEECGTKYSHTENINQKELDELENSTPGWVPDCPKCNTNKYVIMKSYKKITESANDNEAMLKRIKDATGYDDEYCRKIIEDGDYVWFEGVDNEEDLGKAYVDMVGMQGISDKSKYIDEEKYRDSWRELAEENIREENPNLDEDEFEAEVEKWLDAVVPEQLEIAKLDGENLDKYFDYEALGRDLNFEDYYFVDDGCIGIFN